MRPATSRATPRGSAAGRVARAQIRRARPRARWRCELRERARAATDGIAAVSPAAARLRDAAGGGARQPELRKLSRRAWGTAVPPRPDAARLRARQPLPWDREAAAARSSNPQL